MGSNPNSSSYEWVVFSILLSDPKPKDKKVAMLTYGKNYWPYLQCSIPKAKKKKTHTHMTPNSKTKVFDPYKNCPYKRIVHIFNAMNPKIIGRGHC
jgi:hypothetical protein